jgi:hypothetical protein
MSPKRIMTRKPITTRGHASLLAPVAAQTIAAAKVGDPFAQAFRALQALRFAFAGREAGQESTNQRREPRTWCSPLWT